jgi:hypothetical protein
MSIGEQIMHEEPRVCRFCHREVRKGERRYYSHQAGMKGHYHWECFVEACRQANRVGAQEIESLTVGGDAVDHHSVYSQNAVSE